MKFNSVLVRIWLPFLAAVLVLLYFLTVYVPSLQRSTLERFYRSKLQTVALAVDNVVGYGLETYDFRFIQASLNDLDSVPLIDRMGYFTYDDDTLEVQALGESSFGLKDLLRENVTLENLSLLSGGDHPTLDDYFLDGRLGGVDVQEFLSLMDGRLIATNPISEIDGIVYQSFVTGSEDKFDQEVNGLRQPFVVLQALLAIGAISLFVFLAFYITRPILEVTEVANELRLGNYEVEVNEVSTLNEIGALTSALLSLRDELNVQREENQMLTNEMESKIVQRTAELEQALLAKDEFLSTMSHEIRTPLHSLIAIGDMLKAEEDHGKQEDLLASLGTSSRQLLTLINDILDFSKISAGKLELNVEPIVLKGFLEELIQPFQLMASKEVQFSNAWSDSIKGLSVSIDAMRLSQVLHNLLSNAFKFTQQGEVVLAIRHREGPTPDQIRLEFQVFDTGVGINQPNIERIQEAFTQENSSISRKFGGSGLGLSIVKSLLELMGSRLQVESTLGEGSMFGFELTLDLAEKPDLSSDLQTHSAISLKGFRMLYVEDMEPNRFVMKAMVKPWEVALDMASSGHEALNLVREHDYDLILMDIQMPEMDGVETLLQIKQEYGAAWQVPVVAFTAHAQDRDVLKYKKAGFAEVLTKPAGPDVLKACLHKHFGSRGAFCSD
jgi:signal transduction histidine kinase/ActR/RegA family two-component response regulator